MILPQEHEPDEVLTVFGRENLLRLVAGITHLPDPCEQIRHHYGRLALSRAGKAAGRGPCGTVPAPVIGHSQALSAGAADATALA
jgi:hypothetical protein